MIKVKPGKTKRRISVCLGIISLVLGIVPYVISVITQEVEALDRIHYEYQSFLVLFWFASIAIGILTIIIGRSAKFKIGVILGRIGVGVGAFFFLTTLLLFWVTISDGRVHCRFQMQDLSSVIQQYCTQSDGTLPDAEAWCDQLLEYVENVNEFSLDIFVGGHNLTCCPPGIISDFAFNKNLDRCKLSEVDRLTVLLFESDPGWNQNGTSSLLASEGHPGFWPFCEGGYHFVFVGPGPAFTVKFIKNSELDSLNWTPGARNDLD